MIMTMISLKAFATNSLMDITGSPHTAVSLSFSSMMCEIHFLELIHIRILLKSGVNTQALHTSCLSIFELESIFHTNVHHRTQLQ